MKSMKRKYFCRKTAVILMAVCVIAAVSFVGAASWGTAWAAGEGASFRPVSLTVEGLTDPMGIDSAAPRLAWKGEAVGEDAFGLAETAYQILTASSMENLAADYGDLWDSGWVTSDDSIQIPYAGKTLHSPQRVYWKVRIKDQNGKISDWSAPGFWSMGKLAAEDWQAKWIGQPPEFQKAPAIEDAFWVTGSDSDSAQNAQESQDSSKKQKFQETYFRKEFEVNLSQEDIQAKKYFTAIHYAGNEQIEIYLNGQKAGFSAGLLFNPDLLRTIDAGGLIKPGKNLLAVRVFGKSEFPLSFLTKLTIQKIDPPDNVTQGEETQAKETRGEFTPGRGTPGEILFSLVSDSSWQAFAQTSEEKAKASAKEKSPEWTRLDFDSSDWVNAQILAAPDDGPWGKLRRFGEQNSPAFKKEFRLAADKKVKDAALFISGLGFYDAYLDQKRIEGRLLDPAFTRYDKRVLYSVYDLTKELQKPADESGVHSLNILLGHGWWDLRSIAVWNFDAAPWRSAPCLLAQLDVAYEDGTRETIATDETWDSVTSPILYDCIRQGEIVDGGFKEKTLGKAVCTAGPAGKLCASAFPGTKAVREFSAKSVTETEPGVWVIDLGENIAGWARVRMKGLPKGRVVRFRYSERIAEDGGIDPSELKIFFAEGSPSYYAGKKGELQTDFYIAGGSETEIFEPRFTYSGFQYIEVTGLENPPQPSDFTAVVLANAFPQIGTLESSSDLINQIQEAALHSYQANFVNGFPTDCPHREKNGWTGDAQVSAEEGILNWDNTACYEKWVTDFCDEQRPDGELAAIVPTGGWGYVWGNGPAWDSALVIIPWLLYNYRGDLRILEESFDAMARCVDGMASHADSDFLISHGQGDWSPFKSETHTQVTSSGYFYSDAVIVAESARLLGKKDAAEKYETLAEKIREGYQKKVITAEGVCGDGTLTGESCPLYMGIADNLPAEGRQAIFDQLVKAVIDADYHFDVGIFGLKYTPRTLSEFGRTDLALRMLFAETPPCYADWFRKGEKTLRETWTGSGSWNHIFFGDISAWFYQYLAGIQLKMEKNPTAAAKAARPAFKEILIAPECRRSSIQVPGKEPLRRVCGAIDSAYGVIRSGWEWDQDLTHLTLDVEIPVNTTAEIYIPLDEGQTAAPSEGSRRGVRSQRDDMRHGEKVRVFEVGSGVYHFDVQ